MNQVEYKNALGGPHVAETERRVVVHCGAPGCTNRSAGHWQRKDRDGAWMPDTVPELNKLGWVVQDDTLFCSKQCAHRVAYSKKSELAVTAVRSLNDASYQRTHVPMPDRPVVPATRIAPKPQAAQTRNR